MVDTNDTRPSTLHGIIDADGIFDPSERVRYSDSIEEAPSIFISIHCDSFPQDASVSGTRIYYQNGYGTEVTKKMALQIADSIDKIDKNRKETVVKGMSADDAFTVIHNRGEKIAFLIECGFITSESDAALLKDPNWQSAFANAVAIGIFEFCN
jgi:N-acetylmuramoyl-L-alanine amidase